MRIQSILTAFRFAGFLLLFCSASPVAASSDIALADILDENGQISNPAQWTGSVDFSGYYPVMDECGLRFLPAPPSSIWTYLGSGVNSIVHTIAISGSNVYIGGVFTDAAGIPEADRIVLWNSSTNTWSALGSGLSSTVFTIAVSGSDVYVGGNFLNAGNDPSADYIARWNGTSWSALGPAVINGSVRKIAASGSNVFIAGLFTNFDMSKVAYWNGNYWSGLGFTFFSDFDIVTAVEVVGNDVYIGGAFTNVPGLPVGCSNIAKWNKQTYEWSALQSGLNSSVSAITVSGTDIYVGGFFTDAGGNPNADYIARWNTLNNTWNALENTSVLNNGVSTIAISGNQIFLGGSFTDVAGVASSDYTVSWDGNTWDGLGAGFNSICRSIAIDGNSGYVYFGGSFTSASGNPNANRLAVLEGAVLPVELITFQAHRDEKQVLLDWRTATETNNLGWDIEHSTDARQWEMIGFVHGNGNSSQENNYHFVHPAPTPGANYYRLKQSDHNGQYEYSKVVEVMMSGIGEQTGAFYPNPAHSGLVSLDYYAEKEGDLHVSVFDALGRLMILQNQPLNAERNLLQFDFSQLTPGTYSVLLEDGASQVYRTLTIQ